MFSEPPRQTDDREETNEQRKVHTPDVSSQDNSDEDDEATLREQLLKSLAVKRKAKLDVRVITECYVCNANMNWLVNHYYSLSAR